MERKTVCKNCNKEFIKIYSGNRYCSEECQCEYYSKKNNSPLNCLNCNKKLKASRIQEGCKCCSKECSIEYNRRPEIAKERAKRIKEIAEKAKLTRANWSEERVAEEKRKRKERLENMTEEEKREYSRKVSEGKKNSPIKEETYRKVSETRKNKSEEEKEQIRLKIFNSKQWYRDELIAKEVGWENLENFKSSEFNRRFIVTIRNVQYFDIQSAMKFYKAKFRRIRAAMSIYWKFDMPILKLSGVSYEELRIFEYLSNKYQNITFRSSVNNLIRSPETGSLLELDIVGYIDERPVIAIEYNGIRWHGENGNSDREYLKTCLCGEIGIPLYHIWEHRTEEGLVPVEVFLESLSRK